MESLDLEMWLGNSRLGHKLGLFLLIVLFEMEVWKELLRWQRQKCVLFTQIFQLPTRRDFSMRGLGSMIYYLGAPVLGVVVWNILRCY